MHLKQIIYNCTHYYIANHSKENLIKFSEISSWWALTLVSGCDALGKIACFTLINFYTGWKGWVKSFLGVRWRGISLLFAKKHV